MIMSTEYTIRKHGLIQIIMAVIRNRVIFILRNRMEEIVPNHIITP